MTISLLALGFFLGLKHAVEADHVAAVASLASRSASLRETLRVAGAWGVGHAAVLMIFGAVLVLLGMTLPEGVALALEAGVGVMLVVLGLGVIRGRATNVHTHDHVRGLAPRAMLVGGVHGLAGTAALVLLAVPAMESSARAIGYLALFGIGTIAGMVGFSLVLSLPLRFTARRLGRFRGTTRALDVVVGAANLVLGAWIAVASISRIF